MYCHMLLIIFFYIRKKVYTTYVGPVVYLNFNSYFLDQKCIHLLNCFDCKKSKIQRISVFPPNIWLIPELTLSLFFFLFVALGLLLEFNIQTFFPLIYVFKLNSCHAVLLLCSTNVGFYYRSVLNIAWFHLSYLVICYCIFKYGIFWPAFIISNFIALSLNWVF